MTNVFGLSSDVEENTGKHIKLPALAEFAAHLNSVEVTVGEVSQCLQSYAICISVKNDRPRLEVILGLIESKNFYVLPDSSWAVSYVPALVRAYPFCYDLENPDSVQKLQVFDEAITEGTQTGNILSIPERLDENATLIAAKKILDRFRTEWNISRNVAQTLYNLNLLEPWPLTIQISGKRSRLHDVFKINEDRLKSLPANIITELMQKGYLGIAYAMLLSEERLNTVQKLASRHAKAIEARDYLHNSVSDESEKEIDFDF